MIHDVERFGADLQSTYNQESEFSSPPLTYEAYNAALGRHLYEFKSKIIDIEKNVLKQGKFMSLIRSLFTAYKLIIKHLFTF